MISRLFHFIKNNFFYITSYATLFLVQCLIIVLAFWAFYPYKTLTFKDPVFPVVSKVVRAGESVQFVSNYCKYFNGMGRTSRAYVDTVLFYIPPVASITSKLPKGCGSLTVSVPTSTEMATGSYYIRNIYEYQVNPIRTIVITHDTEKFTIVSQEATVSGSIK